LFQTGGTWNRGEIFKVDKDKETCDVYAFDHGTHNYNVPFENIRNLSGEYVKYSTRMAIECYLYSGIKDSCEVKKDTPTHDIMGQMYQKNNEFEGKVSPSMHTCTCICG